MKKQKIYVYLPEEAVDVWRPTEGLALGNDIYQILPTTTYATDSEAWEFPPGSIVRCQMKLLSNGEKLVATTLVKPV